jgi:hypothetical protein
MQLHESNVDVTRESEILRRLRHDRIIWLIQIIDTTRFHCLVTGALTPHQLICQIVTSEL